MRIVSISEDFLERCAAVDREFMQKRGRPCLLVVRLKYRGGEGATLRFPSAPTSPQMFQGTSTSHFLPVRRRGLGTATGSITSRCSLLRGAFFVGFARRATPITRP